MAVDTHVCWKRPESVLVVVHAASGEVLLLDRADDPTFRQSVTGSLEAGESPAAAARRELREETGLDLVPTDRAERSTFEIRGPWRARYAPGVTHNLEHVFEVRVERPLDVTLDPAEHVGFAWLPAAAAMALATSATNRAAIGRIAGRGEGRDAGRAADRDAGREVRREAGREAGRVAAPGAGRGRTP